MASDAAAPIIRLRNITKVYGEGATQFQALKGVDLDIAAGDFVAVMGPSGSGKSTTMNILGCLDVPSAGTFLFRGHHVEALDRDQRALLRRRHACAGLTERESDVARLVAAGYTDKDVARTLGIGVPTVRTHLRRVMAKKGVANRASLAAALA